MKLFLDTTALVAYYNISDKHHSEAAEILRKIKNKEMAVTKIFTSDFIIDESLTTILALTKRHDFAVNLGKSILESPFIEKLWTTTMVFEEAWKLFQVSSRQRYSFTDCVSFVHMKNLHIETAFSFDEHFKMAGFNTIP